VITEYIRTPGIFSASTMLNARVKYAGAMRTLASNANKIATRMMVKEEQFVEKAKVIGKGPLYRNHRFQFNIDADGFQNIAVMVWQIEEKAQFEIDHIVHPPPPAVEDEEESGYTGRTKATAYSADTRKKQALQLRVIRHAHAKKTIHLAYALKSTLIRMRKIDFKIRKAKALAFERESLTFKEVLETLDGFLNEVQAVADAAVPPPLPSELSD
jgi:hypothetical protein